MADAIDSFGREEPHVPAGPFAHFQRLANRLHRHHNDTWLAATALFGALLALPLAQSTWHGPEVAAVLAVSATALFAGQRWAIALIVIAELFLIPTVWPRAFLGDDLLSRVIALMTLVAIVPGVLAMRRAAVVLVALTCERRTPLMCRRVHAGLIAISVIAVIVPLL
jgi:hypothetical protein